MRQRLLTIALVGLLVGACGGGGDGDGGDGDGVGTADPTSTQAPLTTIAVLPTTAALSTTTTSTSTTTTGGSALSPSSTLDLRGLGPVRVGMTPAEATAAAGVSITGDGNPECTYATVDGGPPGVLFMLEEGQIVRVDVRGPSPVKTRSGVGIGDTEAQVQARYPGIEVSRHKYDPAGHYLTLVPVDAADADYRLIFETDGSKVTTFRSGRLPAVAYVEGCS